MKLVIVESPSKAKTIEKYLGKDYHVIASKGHIADLPKGKIGVDIENGFEPVYEVTNKVSAKLIKDNFKTAEEVILAVDPDREGEAIGWHIARVLKLIKDNGNKTPKSKPLKRIVFTEITKTAIQESIKYPRDIDMNLVNAQQARRILDRIVGYKLSPLLWKKITTGLSAGRVQSAAVRIVVDREAERDKFDSQEYWDVQIYLSLKDKVKGEYIKISSKEETKAELDGLKFELIKIDNKKPEIVKEDKCKKIFKDVSDEKFIISDIEEKKSSQYAKPPFTTSTLQQTASNVLGFTASRTMRIAQSLYEAGYISYMRTDSTNLSGESIESIRKYISSKFGKEYLPEKPIFYKSKSALTQEAHEAIRPSDVSKDADSLKLNVDQAKLYNVIWKRTMSCQMQPAIMMNTSVKIEIKNYIFQLTNPKVIFPGCLILYKHKLKEFSLPDLTKGQELFLNQFVGSQHFTEPPARYTEATLIKEMEKNGIGRPSTYAPTISTILARKYVVKDGKALVPSATGKIVNKLLVNNFSGIVDLGFTANMEGELDKVAEGNLEWRSILSTFYKPFEKELKKAEKDVNKQDYVKIADSDKDCPICKKKMILRIGRFGEYLSCQDYPECKGILSISKNGETSIEIANKSTSDEFVNNYKSAPKTEEGKDYTLKFGRYGYYWAHPEYPKVKDARPLELLDDIFAQIYGKKPLSSDGKVMILKRGRFGEFWAHPDYPAKKEIINIKKSEIEKKKKELGLS
jgi:DNA topoisomerase-1